MNYWWVNQNKTHSYEISGGYMWSPKTNRNGAKNVFYDNMNKVKPGDIVFSFFNQTISYLGVVKSNGYSRMKPEFGSAGDSWDSEGWMVSVDYREIRNTITPKNHIMELRDLLPKKYSPLQHATGKGLQGVYLAKIPQPLAEKLLDLIGDDIRPIISESSENQYEIKTDIEAEEERIEKLIKKDKSISETEKETLIKSRKGQGKFRKDVLELFKACPFTGIENPTFLNASHIKPWVKCDNAERLDPLNGLPLTPVADHLFDKGFITFENDGQALFSKHVLLPELKAMGLYPEKEYSIKIISSEQKRYLEYHRNNVFKRW